MISPDWLFWALKREVIDWEPQIFKIAALMNIKSIFPPGSLPFYAGFGNRETDTISYWAVGVELSKIFIINTEGQVMCYNSKYWKSYPLLTEMVDEMFPAFKEKEEDFGKEE